MSPELTIGPAGARDAGPIARLARTSIEGGLPHRWSEVRVRRAIAHPDILSAVARLDARFVGFAIAQIDERAAHLVLFAVAPSRRRSGLGSALLTRITDAALLAGKRAMTLEVRASAEGARAFYERAGFVRTGMRRGYYSGREDAIVMRRAIGREIAEGLRLEDLWGEGWIGEVR